MNNDNEYFNRMVNEAEELRKKVISLGKFRYTDLSKGLSSKKQWLMNTQYSCMVNYLDVLEKRIKLEQ